MGNSDRSIREDVVTVEINEELPNRPIQITPQTRLTVAEAEELSNALDEAVQSEALEDD